MPAGDLAHRLERPLGASIHLELYDLERDPGEQHELAPADPTRAAELHAKLAAWRTGMDARMPTPNPAYDPGRKDGR